MRFEKEASDRQISDFNPISALARSSFITFLLLKNVFVIIIRKKVAVVFGLGPKETRCVESLFY